MQACRAAISLPDNNLQTTGFVDRMTANNLPLIVKWPTNVLRN
jgi:hypothetical protein